jgi:hypothetical protein
MARCRKKSQFKGVEYLLSFENLKIRKLRFFCELFDERQQEVHSSNK